MVRARGKTERNEKSPDENSKRMSESQREKLLVAVLWFLFNHERGLRKYRRRVNEWAEETATALTIYLWIRNRNMGNGRRRKNQRKTQGSECSDKQLLIMKPKTPNFIASRPKAY